LREVDFSANSWGQRLDCKLEKFKGHRPLL
jgi:hypothetical protein